MPAVRTIFKKYSNIECSLVFDAFLILKSSGTISVTPFCPSWYPRKRGFQDNALNPILMVLANYLPTSIPKLKISGKTSLI